MIIFFVRFGSASHYLRYGQPNAYTEGTCGQPLWTSINAGSPLPDKCWWQVRTLPFAMERFAVKTFMFPLSIQQRVNIGKTWLQEQMPAQTVLRVVRVSPRKTIVAYWQWALEPSKLPDWTAVESTNMVHNRVDAPTNALAAGNNNHGPLYVCRLHTSWTQETLVGSMVSTLWWSLLFCGIRWTCCLRKSLWNSNHWNLSKINFCHIYNINRVHGLGNQYLQVFQDRDVDEFWCSDISGKAPSGVWT